MAINTKYAVARTLCGKTDDIRLFPTEVEAVEGMKDAIREFFSEIGIDINMPEELTWDGFCEDMEACQSGLYKATTVGKLPDCCLYGINGFSIDTVKPKLFEVGYETEDDFGSFCCGDIPYLTWNVLKL